MEVFIQICALLAIPGAVVYAIGDVFLLAGKVRLEDHPNLQPYLKALSGAETMVGLPSWRLLWGGLLGVFATPFILAGFAQVFVGLSAAGLGAAMPPAILFACAAIVGAFVHGSFIYLGEYVQALDKVSTDSQPVIMAMFMRHRTIMIVTYGFLFACVLVASIWFSVVVALGRTVFPIWMAAVNPVTMFMLWLVVKRILPKGIAAHTEGAGFNIAYLLFFSFTTLTLWNS